MQKPSKRWLIIGLSLLVLVGGVTAIAVASGSGSVSESDEGANDDDATEKAITGDALEKASEAALQHTGGGTVTDTEVEDEESYYEVEVTREDGSQVDVQLDEDFNVVGSEEESGADD